MIVSPQVIELVMRGFRAVAVPVLLISIATTILAPLLFLGKTDAFNPDTAPRHASDSVHKVAANALFQFGYYRVYTPRERAGDNTNSDAVDEALEAERETSPRSVRFFPVELSSLLECSPDASASAIMVTEAYLRPSWRRQLEISIADSLSEVTGYYPDWSYGLGQIRLSTAMQVLEASQARVAPLVGPREPMSRSDVFASLSGTDTCETLALIGLIADPALRFDRPSRELAAAYRGGAGPEDVPGVLSYDRLVGAIATRLKPDFGDRGPFPAQKIFALTRDSDASPDLPAAGEDTSTRGSQSVFCLARNGTYLFTPFELRSVVVENPAKLEANRPPTPEWMRDREPTPLILREALIERLSAFPAERHNLNIHAHRGSHWSQEHGVRGDPDWSLSTTPFSQLLDEVSILTTLSDIGLSLDRDWAKISYSHMWATRSHDCPIEIVIEPAVPGLLDDLEVQWVWARPN